MNNLLKQRVKDLMSDKTFVLVSSRSYGKMDRFLRALATLVQAGQKIIVPGIDHDKAVACLAKLRTRYGVWNAAFEKHNMGYVFRKIRHIAVLAGDYQQFRKFVDDVGSSDNFVYVASVDSARGRRFDELHIIGTASSRPDFWELSDAISKATIDPSSIILYCPSKSKSPAASIGRIFLAV